MINCGPRSVLTSFTAAARWGLGGWERDEVHVLAPAGTIRPRLRGLVLHRTRDWSRTELAEHRRLHRAAPAVLVAAASFATPRPACGLLAAAVQQQLVHTDDLRAALANAPRLRHRRSMCLAVDDIAQGAQALSEIDLRRLCARFGLPAPAHQAVRIEPNGRRRYLDAEWRLTDGRVVAVEVDGALHLTPRRWQDDQLRQNEVVLGGTLVLRYPSFVVRNEQVLVAQQLARALGVSLFGNSIRDLHGHTCPGPRHTMKIAGRRTDGIRGAAGRDGADHARRASNAVISASITAPTSARACSRSSARAM